MKSSAWLRLAGYVTVTLMTFDISSQTAFESMSSSSCNQRIRPLQWTRIDETDLLYGVINGLQRLQSLGMQQVSEGDLYRRHLGCILQQPLLVWVRRKVPAWRPVIHTHTLYCVRHTICKQPFNGHYVHLTRLTSAHQTSEKFSGIAEAVFLRMRGLTDA